jgi:hypothetical protein
MYTLPTQCDRITTTATATEQIDAEQIDAELSSLTLFPIAIARSSATRPAVATVRAAEVTPGPWQLVASGVGPFPPDGSPPATADVRTVGHCRTFDPTVTSSTGDTWLSAVQASPPPFTPLVLQPGQTGTITVTFTPSGPSGTVVAGQLFVDDFSEAADTGEELTAIPYTYTIG